MEHPRGRAVYYPEGHPGETEKAALEEEMERLKAERALEAERQGDEATLQAMDQHLASLKEDERRLRLEQSHPLHNTQFVLEYCVAVTPCRQGDEIQPPALPARKRRRPVLEEWATSHSEVSHEMLLCTGQCYTTEQDIEDDLKKKLEAKYPGLYVSRRTVADDLKVDKHKDFSYFVTAPAAASRATIMEMKKLLESPDYIKGVGVAKVMFLYKQDPRGAPPGQSEAP